jgi:opacity protein-like surface antigen
MKSMLLAAAAAIVFASPAAAQITVDGNYDAAYGAATSTVAFDPAQASFNFGAPAGFSETSNYSIYLRGDAGFVYGLLRADRVTGLPFANLYFDLDYQTRSGSDLGFEITNDRAFVPGVPGYAENLAGLEFAQAADGMGVEFRIANSLFTGPIAGLSYNPNVVFPAEGGSIRLNLSQSFGYAVAGGATTYGTARLGVVTLDAAVAPVPEPATWAMMIMGFGLVGGAMRRRRTSVAFA